MELRFFYLSTLPDNALYLYQVSQKYLKGFHSYSADTISLLIFSKRRNSIIKVGEVMFLVLCTSSDDALYLCQASLKYHKGLQSY